MSEAEPYSEEMKPVPEQAEEVWRTGTQAVAAAVASLREPDMPLDLLARSARAKPLAALVVAFVAGYVLARRR